MKVPAARNKRNIHDYHLVYQQQAGKIVPLKEFKIASCELDKILFLNAMNEYMTELMRRETRNQYKLINTTNERIMLIQYPIQYAGSSFLESSETESDIGEPEEGGSRKRKRKSKFVAKAGDKGQMARVNKILKLNADGRTVKLPKTGSAFCLSMTAATMIRKRSSCLWSV
ncbi:hypothetical protein RvY_12028 [Ramazzottius varieornatus]|uniref:Uncharacterized protein n=1 Tax=Ramazzottius varieornatus TaxID=947166 RepID=A0A1D1VK47_RAMVA|nr:hypothetical protein RvY_12028 [Ramazzottius varieornatus]